MIKFYVAMLRYFFTLLPFLLFFEQVQAQKSDSVVLKMNNDGSENLNAGRIVYASDSTNFILTIMTPPDISSDIKINAVKIYYPNGTMRLKGTAIINVTGAYVRLWFVGKCISFYTNGHQKSFANYKYGNKLGFVTEYYPNGVMYNYSKYNSDNKLQLIECHDSTNKVLAIGGNGNWLKFDETGKHIVQQGGIADSLKEGEWTGFINDSVKYIKKYHKGNFVPTSDTAGMVYIAVDQPPSYDGGMQELYTFLEKNLRVPAVARENHIQGRVFVSVTVEKDGSLTNIIAIKGPDKSLNDEAVRVVKLSSPWIPGIVDNKPVRSQYTLPLRFNMLY